MIEIDPPLKWTTRGEIIDSMSFLAFSRWRIREWLGAIEIQVPEDCIRSLEVITHGQTPAGVQVAIYALPWWRCRWQKKQYEVKRERRQ